MATPPPAGPGIQRPLRLWPGVVAAVLLVLARFGLPLVLADGRIFAVLGALLAAVVILVWWLFFSRALWSERLGATLLMVVALGATSGVVHESIRGGMMGRMLLVYATPTLTLALVIGAMAGRRLAIGPRRAVLAASILVACGFWTLLRTDGITGGGGPQLAWRWTPTAEERLLAQAAARPRAQPKAADAARTPEMKLPSVSHEPAAPAAAPAPKDSVMSPATTGKEPGARVGTPSLASKPADWPGFRGPDRNDVVSGVRIRTDWAVSPPVELWRRSIGPGWSSFAVKGDVLYTQEQRGEDEVVASYAMATGQPVWMHRDPTRFWESNGGAGPRATPTVSGGRVYTLGATGVLNSLDARSGAVVWSRDVARDTGVKVPGWGFAGSPILFDDAVIVSVSGALAAYDMASGDRRWFVASRGGGYSSPHLVTLHGVPQVLLMGGHGATSVAPQDGTLLWDHPWAGSPIVQPALISGGDLLISTADAMGGLGTRRLALTLGGAGWAVSERWTSRGLKPYFNDFVVHKGHAYGFDGSILACIDLADGARKWKGGRYGNGQLVLLPDQDLLLVLSEDGELALVGAVADQYSELARRRAIEGKTWNHPVLVGDVLLVRNDQEMVAFRLSLAGQPAVSPNIPGS